MNDLEESALRKTALDILRIRLSVLTLGEIAKPPWWGSKFLTDVGFRFLERLYPRSAFSAAVYSAGKAACEVHDQAIGRQGVYHLFRMPVNLEQEIRALLYANDGTIDSYLTIVKEAEESRSLLAEIASLSADDERIGPARIGTTEDILRPDLYQLMAAVYLKAFDRNGRAFPYFEIEEEEE